MSETTEARPVLGRRIATVLRAGTLVAVVLIGAGFAWALAEGGRGAGPRPLTELLAEGRADALIGAGLLGLTLVPLVAVAVAIGPLYRAGERARALTAAAVLLLLAGSLVVAAVIGGG